MTDELDAWWLETNGSGTAACPWCKPPHICAWHKARLNGLLALIEKREVAARIDELVMAMREHPNDNFYERAHARLDQLQDGKDG